MNSPKFPLTKNDRDLIEKDILFYQNEEKRLNAPCLYLLKIDILKGYLVWDDFFKNGQKCSEEDKKIFDAIERKICKSD